MSVFLHDLLKKNIKKMIRGIDHNSKGNVYLLIMEEVEKNILKIVLEETNHNYYQTAQILGIGRSSLYRKMEKFKKDLNFKK